MSDPTPSSDTAPTSTPREQAPAGPSGSDGASAAAASAAASSGESAPAGSGTAHPHVAEAAAAMAAAVAAAAAAEATVSHPATAGSRQSQEGQQDDQRTNTAADNVSVDGEEAGGAETARENAVEISGVPPNDVKNIVLQVMGLYFDDEGGEDDAQRYDHIKAQSWIQLICDGIMEKLLAMRRPYKYVVHCMIMRKCGAGIHVCSSCYYSQSDGWVNHAHDLSAHIYAVVTVYWSVI